MEGKGVSFIGMKLLFGIKETSLHQNETFFRYKITIFVSVKN